ncbi:MAG: ATP-binding protein [Chloroflexi bacterium]|nr:ATP-binding protein [Chloroflexota bacterium]
MSVSSQGAALRDLLSEARRQATGLALFGGVLADPIGESLLELVDALLSGQAQLAQEKRARLFGLLAAEAELYPEQLVGDAWQNHLLDRLLLDENPFSLKAQHGGAEAIGQALWSQARWDLTALRTLFQLSAARLGEVAATIEDLGASWVSWERLAPLERGVALHTEATRGLKRTFAATADWSALAEALAAHFSVEGSGVFGRYRAFRWSRRGSVGHLEGIADPDPIRLDELIGYDRERELLIENTEQFIDGYPANNVLLFGDRGTGKSSTIKALLHAYAPRGLRLIELPKQLLADFTQVMALVRGRRERFVLFVDDLSFDEHETVYKELKAMLEGGVEARPDNVVIYATSNRRHLIVERWSDHDASSDTEIHQMDSVQEKLSLSDRFGVRLFFMSPDQARYLAIVRGLVAQRGLAIEDHELERQAIQWATWQNGRSGRTARQFVDHLTGRLRARLSGQR